MLGHSNQDRQAEGEQKIFGGYCGIQRMTLLIYGLDILLSLQMNHQQQSVVLSR